MSSWSKRRKFTYASIIIILLAVAVFVPGFLYFYKAPSCFDGKQDGSETGIDCGGACQKLCPSSFLVPDVSWTNFEEVAPGLYNLAAYIVNPNTKGEADNVPFHMVVYDDNGVQLTDVSGTVTLPPQRDTLAFLPTVSLGKQTPYRVFFEFTSAPNWYSQSDPLSALSIGDKNYMDTASGSSLSVTLNNSSASPINNLTVFVVLEDVNGNVIGFSKTVVDEVPPDGSAVAPFTWPENRQGKVVSIEVLPVAAPSGQ